MPEAVEDKQRIIDALAHKAPTGAATQVFVAYVPAAEIFETTCADRTCSLEEMESPMKACLTENWDNCVHAMIRHDAKNYCLLEVGPEHE